MSEVVDITESFENKRGTNSASGQRIERGAGGGTPQSKKINAHRTRSENVDDGARGTRRSLPGSEGTEKKDRT